MNIKIIRAAAALAFSTGMLLHAGLAGAADFTTSEGFAETCAQMKKSDNKAQLATDDLRVAFVVCRDTALVRQIITWATLGMKQLETEHPSNEVIAGEVFKEIDYARTRLAESRAVLESIHLGARKSLRLVPAQWSMDLNGDGKIDIWERYFFAIPKRGKQAFSAALPNNEQSHYDNQYQLDAAIKVDQSDVLWALSYHCFIEGLLAGVRAFDLDANSDIRLARPELLKQSHQLILRGINTSEAMRKSVLAETGDDEEWIGNPKQTSSVFPIELEAQDFATWGKILVEWKALWQGRHLLPVARGGLLGQFNLCQPGTGLNIEKLYLRPPPKGTMVSATGFAQFVSPQCQKVDSNHSLSTLPDMIAHARETDTGLQFLRYLYWTN
ncbi:MAG TPA: hypothetical protein VIF60_21235 [Burkholderiaceae bacterium]|jgi:hypothetical protein